MNEEVLTLLQFILSSSLQFKGRRKCMESTDSDLVPAHAHVTLDKQQSLCEAVSSSQSNNGG